LKRQGYDDIHVDASVGLDQVRTDLVATRDGHRLLAELRPAVDSLRKSDAEAIVARNRLAADSSSDCAVVLVRGTSVSEDAREVLHRGQVAVYTVDVDTGDVDEQ